MSVFGIDLGTCNSCIAKCDNRGFIEVQNNADVKNGSTTPSIVQIQEDGMPKVGVTAKNSMVVKAERTFRFVKREMNKEYCEKELPNRKVSPVEIQSCILRYIIDFANKIVINTDREESVKKAVITIPAMFNDTEREKTKLAAQLAGIDVLALIQEPTAAAISYNIKHNETVLVFDLGGGTLDVSIVRNEFGKYSVLGTPAGDPQLGGKDWDEALAELALNRVGSSLTSFSRNGREWAKLMRTAEEVKEILSSEVKAIFELPTTYEGIEITRSEFESVTRGLVNKAIKIVDKAIQNANNPVINRFVLVGGSSLMPMIQRSLENKYSKIYSSNNLVVKSDPHHAIAKGAAKYAGILAGLCKGEISVDDKATHSYGFVYYVNGKCSVGNKISSTDPIEIFNRKFTLFPFNDNQTHIDIQIIENDRTEELFDYNNEPILIEQTLELPPNTSKTTPIHYILNRDRNGIIDVHVSCGVKELKFKAKEIISDAIRRQIVETIRKKRETE